MNFGLRCMTVSQKNTQFGYKFKAREVFFAMSVENTHYGAERIAQMLDGVDALFFIGIGGISMSALASMSRRRGFRVGGSDRTRTDLTDALAADGIEVVFGHDAVHLSGYGAVVYTVAIGEDNPEYRAAHERGLPCISRADYLGYLMSKFKRRVGISGMHGKSTCTAMCASIFAHAGDPTVLCGAPLPSEGGHPCRIGCADECMVFEACEYMDSFLDFYPTLAVILNIGMDHVDYFHSMEQIHASFRSFAARVGKDGAVLYNADDSETTLALQDCPVRKIGFSPNGNAEFTAQNVERGGGITKFDFCRNGERLCSISLSVCGAHNLYNALAAASAATLCGISPQQIAEGLSAFRGAGRRMEYRGKLPSGAVVYDDYGHHPDEIKATLAGAREMGYRRILCAYQPHTYSRTAGLLDEFSKAFTDADLVLFADIYAAREQNIYGVTSKTLADRIGESALYCGSFAALADAITAKARMGDLVIIMGAGDIFHTFELLELE